MAKPMKTLELHYPMIQFLIESYILAKALIAFFTASKSRNIPHRHIDLQISCRDSDWLLLACENPHQTTNQINSSEFCILTSSLDNVLCPVSEVFDQGAKMSTNLNSNLVVLFRKLRK